MANSVRWTSCACVVVVWVFVFFPCVTSRHRLACQWTMKGTVAWAPSALRSRLAPAILPPRSLQWVSLASWHIFERFITWSSVPYVPDPLSLSVWCQRHQRLKGHVSLHILYTFKKSFLFFSFFFFPVLYSHSLWSCNQPLFWVFFTSNKFAFRHRGWLCSLSLVSPRSPCVLTVSLRQQQQQ